MNTIKKIRDALVGPDTTDEALYAVVAREIASGTLREGLWAMALANAQFDETTAKAKYISLRVATLKQELADATRIQYEQERLSAKLHSAFTRKSYDECFVGWSQLAEAGDCASQYWLGVLYSTDGWSGRSLYFAYLWGKVAQLNGHPDASWFCYSLVPQMMSFDIKRAEDEANRIFNLSHRALPRT